MDTDSSGTVNIGAQSSYVNIGNGSQITGISIGSGASSVPTTVDIGAKTSGSINVGVGMTDGTINVGTGMTTGTINIGTASNGGGSVINLGGPGDTINMLGTTTYINTTNLDVSENLITLNKGASYTSITIKGAGIQLTRRNLAGNTDTFPGWVRTDVSSNATTWEIVPPNHPVSAFAEIGNGLAVCNIANALTTETTYPTVGLRTTLASDTTVQNLVLQRDGNVGIGYSDAASAVPSFPSSKLHIESTAGNQITLGNGKDSGSTNYVRTYISSPLSGNSNVILAVGRGSDATLRAATPALLTRGFRFAYAESDTASSSTLTLACTQGGTTFASPNLTFFRSDGTALFTSNLCVDAGKYFRMYNSTFSVVSPTANLTFEVNGSGGIMRIGNGAYVTADPSAGSLTLGSHIVLNNDSSITPNKSNRPSGRKGLLRFNDDNNSAEIFDGTKWADVGYYAGLPLGAIIVFPSVTTPPSDAFKLCDGTSLPTTGTYADLFGVIAYTYGGSDASGTFNLPNIKGRTIVGYDGTDASFNSLGLAGGFKTHALSVNEMPLHRHNVPSTGVTGSVSSTFTGIPTRTGYDKVDSARDLSFGHYHDTTIPAAVINYQATYESRNSDHKGYEVASAISTNTQTSANYHTHAFTASGSISSTFSGTTLLTPTEYTGLSNAHNNLQPYIVLNYFIKVLKDSKQYTTTFTSDIRVKRNIVPMQSEQAIDAIRLLQPKRYEYIDRNMSAFETHIGFIAQEAKLCIPESVCTKRDYIPNIYSMAKLTLSTSVSPALLTSVQHPITKLIRDELLRNTPPSSLKGIKLKMFNKSKECFYVSCVEAIDDYNVLVEPLDATTTAVLLSADYFVYGQEIDDYHYMNNDAVFSTLVSAFQALDDKVTIQAEMLKTQQIIIEKLLDKLI
jgi:microcystin-dependent protein